MDDVNWTITLYFCNFYFEVQEGHDNWVRNIQIDLTGNYLISCSDDKTVKIWDLKLGRIVKSYQVHDHFTTCFDMLKNYFATGSVDQSIKFWICNQIFLIFVQNIFSQRLFLKISSHFKAISKTNFNNLIIYPLFYL